LETCIFVIGSTLIHLIFKLCVEYRYFAFLYQSVWDSDLVNDVIINFRNLFQDILYISDETLGKCIVATLLLYGRESYGFSHITNEVAHNVRTNEGN
jgi:hypothetical protein